MGYTVLSEISHHICKHGSQIFRCSIMHIAICAFYNKSGLYLDIKQT